MLNKEASYILGDIGGTRIRFGLSKNLKKIDKVWVFETPKNYKEFLNLIGKFSNEKFRKACFGLAGNFNCKKEKLIYAPNLKDYEGKDLKKDLEKILKCEVILENDACLAGLGEAYFGAGKGYKIFSYITFSSGIGGVKIVNYKPDDNIFGFEPGHSLFLLNQEKNKTLIFEAEDLIGGKNLEEIFQKRVEEIKDKKIWLQLTKLYALFLVNVSLFWSPGVIVVGGGLSKNLNFKVLNKNFQKFHPLGWKIKILKSKLKDLSGVYGCLILLDEKIQINNF